MRTPTRFRVLTGVALGAGLFVACFLMSNELEGEIQRPDVERPDIHSVAPLPRVEQSVSGVSQAGPSGTSEGASAANSPRRDLRHTQEPMVPPPRPPIAEPAFAPSPTSGGLLVRLAPSGIDFELIAVMVPYIVEYRPVSFAQGPPSVRTIRTWSVEGVAFVPYLGQERITCWIRSRESAALFENLRLSFPPAPPNEITLELKPDDHRGIVIGNARFTDGRPAVGYDIRVNPEGSSMWDAPLDVHSPAHLRAAMGRATTTDENGNFEVTGLLVGEGALIALSHHGQVLAGATNISIVASFEGAHRVSLIVPAGSTRTVAVTCGGRRVAGCVLYVSAEGIPISNIRCDRRGEASIFVPNAAQTATIGFSAMAFVTHREVLHALSADGFPQELQIRLFGLLGLIESRTRVTFEPGKEPDRILILDLDHALAELTRNPDAAMLSICKGVRGCIEGSTSVAPSIRNAIEAGRIDEVLIRFLHVFGATAAGLGG